MTSVEGARLRAKDGSEAREPEPGPGAGVQEAIAGPEGDGLRRVDRFGLGGDEDVGGVFGVAGVGDFASVGENGRGVHDVVRVLGEHGGAGTEVWDGYAVGRAAGESVGGREQVFVRDGADVCRCLGDCGTDVCEWDCAVEILGILYPKVAAWVGDSDECGENITRFDDFARRYDSGVVGSGICCADWVKDRGLK